VSIVSIVSTLFAANWQQLASLEGDSGTIHDRISDPDSTTGSCIGGQVILLSLPVKKVRTHQ
jgi:hypothetical protein